jgi:Transposase DDE domain
VWNVVDVIYSWSLNQSQTEFCRDMVTIFGDIDDFCQRLPASSLPALASGAGTKKSHRSSRWALSEVRTILVWFHAWHDRRFKHFQLPQARGELRADFPPLPSDTRLVELIPMRLLPLCAAVATRPGQPRGLPLIDSFPIRVCPNRRLHSPKVFAGLAPGGKGSRGWFYGFKRHLVMNQQGEGLARALTPGQMEDRRPVRRLVRPLWGQRLGDRGDSRQELFEQVWQPGLPLLTKLKRNMKNKRRPLLDKVLLRQRALLECVKDQLQNVSPIEHTRHRSASNGMVTMRAAGVAYTLQPKKPALDLSTTDREPRQQLLLTAMAI